MVSDVIRRTCETIGGLVLVLVGFQVVSWLLGKVLVFVDEATRR